MGVEPSLFCAMSGSDLPKRVVSEGGLEESFVEDTVNIYGQGSLSLGSLGDSELEVLPITKNLRFAVEVGSMVSLFCDGQEGMQVDCLKKIAVEKYGKGGDSLHFADQQEEESRFRRGKITVIMKHKILSWNVKGLNDRDKRLRISNLIRLWKVDIACFQETKMVSISNGFVQSLWGCPYVDWFHVDSRGASGGILLMWDRRAISRIDSCMGRFVVACNFRNVDDGLV